MTHLLSDDVVAVRARLGRHSGSPVGRRVACREGLLAPLVDDVYEIGPGRLDCFRVTAGLWSHRRSQARQSTHAARMGHIDRHGGLRSCHSSPRDLSGYAGRSGARRWMSARGGNCSSLPARPDAGIGGRRQYRVAGLADHWRGLVRSARVPGRNPVCSAGDR